MKTVKPEILKLGGVLATGIVAVACPAVLPAMAVSAVHALAPNIAADLLISTNYKAFRDYLRKDHPGKLNHDLDQMLRASLQRTLGFLETLFKEKQFSASPLLHKMRLKKAKENFTALKTAIEDGSFKEKRVSSYLFEEETNWPDELTGLLFDKIELTIEDRTALAAFFKEKFSGLFKLAFEKALKDPANERGWRAFQILMIEEGKKTDKKLEGKLDEVLDILRSDGIPGKTRSALPARPRLPRRRHCFGRDAFVEQLAALLLDDAPKHAFVLGAPGIGKSNLTLASLYDDQVCARFGEQRAFVRCDGITRKDALVFEIAATLGLPPSPNLEEALFAELGKGAGNK